MKFLTDKGFKLDKPNSFEHATGIKELWYRRLPTNLHCKTNEKPPNLVIERYKFFNNNDFRCEISVCGEKDFGWIDYKIYSITEEDLLDKLEFYEEKLVRLWEL